ncbi:hypothetical protein HPB50_026310 [Hyalomma asiaticum]|uniref:Uncharacterized protein n=1 Tax=Hyalomma asiaticum TaxID=266040 RepID=A0ACB7T260_HYAAI|nr:hypothetical protein HPB50_026310 [Hyalomma asiaticum]
MPRQRTNSVASTDTEGEETDADKAESRRARMNAKVYLKNGDGQVLALYRSESLLHKTFHSYTVRAKQGGSQSARDGKQKGSQPKSAGASLRRHNEMTLVKDIQDLLQSWSEELQKCTAVFYRAPGANRAVLFSGKNPPFRKSDPRMRPIPFPTNRATYKEVLRVHRMLCTVECFGSEEDLKGRIPVSPKINAGAKKPGKTVEVGPDINPATAAAAATTGDDVSFKLENISLSELPQDPLLAQAQCDSLKPKSRLVGTLQLAEDKMEDDSGSDSDATVNWEVSEEVVDLGDLKEFAGTRKPRKKKRTRKKGSKDTEHADKPVPQEFRALKTALFNACKAANKEALMSILEALSGAGTREHETAVHENPESVVPEQVPSSSTVTDPFVPSAVGQYCLLSPVGSDPDATPVVEKAVEWEVSAKLERCNSAESPSLTTCCQVVHSHGLEYRLLNGPIGFSDSTLLHYCAKNSAAKLIQCLLEAGADPAVKNGKGLTPYAVCSDKQTRNEFRRFKGSHPEQYDYVAAQERKAAEVQRQQEELEKKRFLSLSDREKVIQDVSKAHVESFNYVLREGLSRAVAGHSTMRICVAQWRPSEAGNQGAIVEDFMLFLNETSIAGYVLLCEDDTRAAWISHVRAAQRDPYIGSPMISKNTIGVVTPQVYPAEEFGGYFVVNGNEKIIRMLIMTRRNYNMVLHYLTNGTVQVMFSYMKELFFMPIMMLLKALCDVSDYYIYSELISGKEDDSFFKGCVINMLRQVQNEGLLTRDQVRAYIGEKFRVCMRLPEWYSDEEVAVFLLRHCICVHTESNVDKFNLILLMIRKLFAVAKGQCAIESADNPMNHEILLAGHLYLMILKVVNQQFPTSHLPSLLVGLGMAPLDGLRPNVAKSYIVVLDGRVLGYVEDSSVGNLVTSLRTMKACGLEKVPQTLEIGFVPKTSRASQYPGVFLFTSVARMMRPVLNMRTNTVEWIGTFEQVHLSICVVPEEAYEGITTHQELRQTSMLSLLANMIPYSDFNQSPRNMYQCQMGKQTMGTPCQALRYRSDNKLYRIQTPQTPLVRPTAYDHYDMDEYPTGTNAIVAVISYTGYDMEDAMVLNKSSVERGFKHGSIYKSEVINLRKLAGDTGRQVSLVFGRKMTDRHLEGRIDLDGLPFIGTKVEHNQPVCSFINIVTGETKLHKYKNMEAGYIHDVKLLGNDTGTDLLQSVCITYWIQRNPMIGDKFASRHGQKGVCSQMWPVENMPFTESGMTPDIIFNPHGFPSRMTIGMMIESMAGKSSVLHGVVHDATPFKFSEDQTASEYFGELLHKAGYNYYGTERMYSGVDGREMEADIFFGVVYYQRLRHMVADKYQVRTTGPVDTLTHQPVKGRKRAGGIRFGEMERDSLLAHGASFLLQDRLFNCSDKSLAYVCRNCQSMLSPVVDKAESDVVRKWKCPTCQTSDFIDIISIPYVFRYLVAELAAMNIGVKLQIK